MKKLLLPLFLVLGLTACDPGGETSNIPINTNFLPDDLKDCKFYKINNNDGPNLNIVKCPGSVVSNDYMTPQGKSSRHDNTITIDGNTYVKQVSKS